MFSILLYVLLQFILLGGAGALFQRLCWRRMDLDFFASFWLGFVAVIAIAQLAHLFVPLNPWFLGAMVIACLPGLPGWVSQVRSAWNSAQRTRQSGRRLAICLAVMALLAFGAASRVALAQVPLDGDTGIYHLNAVRWINTYPAVPGLAHLHDRFGFNSSALVYAAVIDNGPLDRRSAWIMPPFLLLVLAAQLLAVLVFDNRRERLAARIYACIMLIFVIKCIWGLSPSLYYDRSLHCVLAILVLEILRRFGGVWVTEEEKSSALPGTPVLAYLAGLAALCFTLKLPGAFSLLVTAPWVAALVLWKQDRFRMDPKAIRELCAIFWIPALLLLGWFARSAVLSGWLMYPAPIGNLHLPWSVDPDTVTRLLQRVRSWGRMPGASQDEVWNGDFWLWFPKWHLAHYRTAEKDLLWLGGLASLIWFWMRREGASLRKRLVEAFLCVFTLGNLIMWFRSSPDMRFGDVLFWLWFGVMLALALGAARLGPQLTALAVALTGALLLVQVQANIVPTKKFVWWKLGRARSGEVVERVLANGQDPPLHVFVPKGDGNEMGDCPLPATPYPTDTLLMREPGNLRAGFCKAPARR